jgi:hypothetical protein
MVAHEYFFIEGTTAKVEIQVSSYVLLKFQ